MAMLAPGIGWIRNNSCALPKHLLQSCKQGPSIPHRAGKFIGLKLEVPGHDQTDNLKDRSDWLKQRKEDCGSDEGLR